MAPAMQSAPEAVSSEQLASDSYKPASCAAVLGAIDEVPREARRAKLIEAQTALAESLQKNVPSWEEFTELVENLGKDLQATQKASSLSKDAEELEQRTLAVDKERPIATLDALRESQRIADNLTVLARVKTVAEHMQILREHDTTAKIGSSTFKNLGDTGYASSASSFVGATAITTSASANAVGVSSSEVRSLTSPGNTMDYVTRAREIAAARVAASHPSLKSVDALIPIQEELKERFSSLQAELQTLVLFGVFGVPQDDRNDEPVSRMSDVSSSFSRSALSAKKIPTSSKSMFSVSASFLPRLPLVDSNEHSTYSPDAAPVPLGFAPLSGNTQDSLPQIVQALDILCGNGHSGSIIEKAARAQTYSIVEHAVKIESRFANEALGMDGQKFKPRRTALFTTDAPSVSQKLSCAVINRVSFHFTSILRRLNSITDALDKEEINIHCTVSQVRLHLIFGLTFLVDLLISDKNNEEVEMEIDTPFVHSTSSMLLKRSREVRDAENDEAAQGCTNSRSQHVTEMEEFWNSSPISSLLNSQSLNIYNLELMYCVLYRFANDYQALFSGPSSIRFNPTAFFSYVNKLSEKLVRTLSYDLRVFVRGIVGNRAGSLLQPPPLKKRNSQNDPKATAAIPSPPHTEPLSYAVAVCVRIASAIPVIAKHVGNAVANDVFAILKQRSMEALKLAKGWTDAAFLPTDVNQTNDENEFIGNTLPFRAVRGTEKKRSTSNGRGRSKEVELFCSAVNQVAEMANKDRDSFDLLSPNEWRAIVRLILGLNTIIHDIRKWRMDADVAGSGTRVREGTFVPHWSSSIASSHGPLEKLRLLIGKVSADEQSTLMETVTLTLSPIQDIINDLEAEVLVPAVGLLRAESMLRCYCLASKCLREVSEASQSFSRKRKVVKKNGWKAFANADEEYTSSSDEMTSRLFEFDEYGDRIPQSANSTDVQRLFGESQDEAVGNSKSFTVAETRMVGIARNASKELSARFSISRNSLSQAQQDVIVSGLDIGIAAGIRNARPRSPAVAVASRLLLKTLVVEDEGLVGECTDEQCRSIMYASGMI